MGAALDLDFSRPETFGRALEGVDKVFLLTPFTEDQVALGTSFLDAVRGSGARHVVKLSASASDATAVGRWHHAIERHALQIGVPLTLLRASFFFQNFVNYYPPQADGAIYLPWGSGRASFIDVRDIGEVAASVLVEAGHEGKTYRLTGPDAVGAAEIAAAIADVTKRGIRYVDVPEDAARAAMTGLGMPRWMVDAMMELNLAIKSGSEGELSNDAPRVLGKPVRGLAEFARGLAEFARDHADDWSA